jgi:hypothetical protein
MRDRFIHGLWLSTALSVAVGCRPAEREAAGTQAVSATKGPEPQASLPQQIADVMVQLNGGVHTGFRFAHAKGLVLTGT